MSEVTDDFEPPVHLGPVADDRPLCGASLALSLDEVTTNPAEVTCRACLATVLSASREATDA